MKKVLFLLLIAATVNAGRTSQWSNGFTLREPIYSIQKSSSSGKIVKSFGLAVQPRSAHFAAILNVSGIAPGTLPSLCIYEINGKMVADLSGLIRPGVSTIAWRPPASRSGIFIARLQNGSKVQTVRFMIFK